MPSRIAFIGFDEVQLGPYFEPPITTVIQPATGIGEHAARQLLERIDTKASSPGKHLLLDTTLVVRSSCGCTHD